MTPPPWSAEASMLVSEGLCPVDQVRLVRDDMFRAGICPVCAYAFWVRPRGRVIESGCFQTFKQVAHEPAPVAASRTRPASGSGSGRATP